MITYRSDIWRQGVHDLDRRNPFMPRIDNGASKHIACYSVDDVFLGLADLIYIAGQHRDAAY